MQLNERNYAPVSYRDEMMDENINLDAAVGFTSSDMLGNRQSANKQLD
jgi:hypothetical protein